MDPFSTAAGIIAVIQIADRVIELCKYYIETARDAPSDIQHIFVETSSIKAVLDSLHFLHATSRQHEAAHGTLPTQTPDPTTHALNHLYGDRGPVEACRRILTDMSYLFPQGSPNAAEPNIPPNTSKAKAKAILTALAWPLKEGKAKKLLAELVQHKTTVNLALTVDSSRDIKDIKVKVNRMQESMSDEERRRVYSWIRSTDPSNRYYQSCKLYEAGTGDWVFRTPEWNAWVEGQARCLWIYGIPGAGKTILTTHLIDAVKARCDGEERTAYVYYYCYFGNHQDEASPFLRWVIERLCRQTDAVPPHLHQLFRDGAEPSLVDLLRVLETVIQEYGAVYLVIDALDESTPRDDLLRVVRDLATDTRFTKMRILATSRQYIDIENVMSQFSAPISMRNEWLDEDIRLFVKAQLSSNERLRRWPTDLQLAALEGLSAKAKGMFRWVVCQIDVLARLEPRREIIQRALATLPETLDETYQRIFLNIPRDAQIFVHDTLKWVYCHETINGNNVPSSMLLQLVQKSVSSSSPHLEGYSYDIDLLREFCGCLLLIEPETRQTYRQKVQELYRAAVTVTFAHYTVWEFLESTRLVNGPAAHFAVDTRAVTLEYTKLIFLEAISARESALPEPEALGPTIQEAKNAQHIEYDFTHYCLNSSLLCISRLGDDISGDGELKSLAIRLSDATEPHFANL
ncbi:hypothetical protein B0T14DRAFT_430357 [Immersiella caudata]|uniref:NACHT domain-containing protein n=1 Tax=Immersiella caudata TaxID=314043 RepID=A0AA39WP86_9PEZI|nr:hypothetical protein B0T14DRAFT_430357 [Immersiella caudata]